MSRIHTPTTRAPAGFTLVELLLAVTLLVMIILVSSFIFDTTTKAVSHAQANNELNVSLAAFSRILRQDLNAIEHDGFLVIGRREQEAYGSRKDRTDEIKQTFRNDWMTFLTNSEQYSAVDPRAIGQSARIIYGHAQQTNPGAGSNYRNVGTAWVLFRHQVLEIARQDTVFAETTNLGQTDQDNTESYQFVVDSYYNRNYAWFRYIQYQGVSPLDEPANYFSYLPGAYSMRDSWNKHVLPHCAEFKVRFAMAEDLTAGPGGTPLWRDPPAMGHANCPDPNWPRKHAADPLHGAQVIPAAGGRLVFGPGDRWPAMLRVSVWVFDALDRFEGGKKLVVVVPIRW